MGCLSLKAVNHVIGFASLSFTGGLFAFRSFSTHHCERLYHQAVRKAPGALKMHVDRCSPETVQVGGMKFYGVSVAAVETCICVPSLSLAFDAGRSPHGSVPMRYMAITHGHCDHTHGLPLHLATRNLQKLPPATYFVPSEIEADIRNLVDAVGRLEQSSFEPNVVPLTPHSGAIELKKTWVLKPFRTSHTVPSLGYIVYKQKKKLKTEYAGKSGSELARMREEGVQLDYVIEVPEIAFTGDTRLEAIAESEDCRKARILITEMTFLDDVSTPKQARAFGHIHMKEIVEKQHIFQENKHVIFTHFSARYSKDEILDAISKLPSPLKEKSIAFGVGSFPS